MFFMVATLASGHALRSRSSDAYTLYSKLASLDPILAPDHIMKAVWHEVTSALQNSNTVWVHEPNNL